MCTSQKLLTALENFYPDYLWSCYNVFYKIALSINSTSGKYPYLYIWQLLQNPLNNVYQSIPSPIGGTLHEFGQGCSFEVIFGLPKNNNKLQISTPKSLQATHSKPKKVAAFLVANSNTF